MALGKSLAVERCSGKSPWKSRIFSVAWEPVVPGGRGRLLVGCGCVSMTFLTHGRPWWERDVWAGFCSKFLSTQLWPRSPAWGTGKNRPEMTPLTGLPTPGSSPDPERWLIALGRTFVPLVPSKDMGWEISDWLPWGVQIPGPSVQPTSKVLALMNLKISVAAQPLGFRSAFGSDVQSSPELSL